MPKFSQRSLKILSHCHTDLIRLFNEVIKGYDCTVTWGYRGKEDQEKAFNQGFSKAHFGQSPHNFMPAMAVDVVPYPTLYNDIRKLKELGALAKRKAAEMGIEIVWGGDWKFTDLPHYEIKDWRKLVK